ncbi:hypothetical protein BG003_002051 [Podila horticola]|nr:hypothetical protein BG003_002051 [Podila horticola]
MALNPMLQQIQIPAQENNLLGRTGLIHEHKTILARMVIGDKDGSTLYSYFHGQKTPSADIIHWCLDHTSEQMRDGGAEILNAASQKF